MLRTILLSASMLLAIGAEAQVCLDFEDRCDGITLTIDPVDQSVRGIWESFDCEGTDAPLRGFTVAEAYYLVCSRPTCPDGEDWLFAVPLGFSVYSLFNLTQGIPLRYQERYAIRRGQCNF